MNKSFTYSPNPFSKMPKGTKKLPVSSAIYIPNKDKFGRKISDAEFQKRIKEVENKLLELFGGHSTDELDRGEYISKTKRVIREKVSKVSNFSNIKIYKKHRDNLEKWLMKKKKEWNQDSIGYEFEGDMYYL